MKRIKSYNRFVESMEEEGHGPEELGGEGKTYCEKCHKSFELPRNKAVVRDEKGYICPDCSELGGEPDEDY